MELPEFPEDFGERILIEPQSWGPEERLRASAIATEKGVGLRMEVHSSHTEFYADSTVEVGKVCVWYSDTYKGWLKKRLTLQTPDEQWMPYLWKLPGLHSSDLDDMGVTGG